MKRRLLRNQSWWPLCCSSVARTLCTVHKKWPCCSFPRLHQPPGKDPAFAASVQPLKTISPDVYRCFLPSFLVSSLKTHFCTRSRKLPHAFALMRFGRSQSSERIQSVGSMINAVRDGNPKKEEEEKKKIITCMSRDLNPFGLPLHVSICVIGLPVCPPPRPRRA